MHIVYVRTCSHTSSYSLVLSHFRGPIELKVGDGGSKNSTHSAGNVDITAGNAHVRSEEECQSVLEVAIIPMLAREVV